MKANEAPDKIYIHPDIGGKEFLRPWLHRPANSESIEYVRKDAFIEKAKKYLEEHFINDISIIAGGYVNIRFNQAFENFIKYMKGE